MPIMIPAFTQVIAKAKTELPPKQYKEFITHIKNMAKHMTTEKNIFLFAEHALYGIPIAGGALSGAVAVWSEYSQGNRAASIHEEVITQLPNLTTEEIAAALTTLDLSLQSTVVLEHELSRRENRQIASELQKNTVSLKKWLTLAPQQKKEIINDTTRQDILKNCLTAAEWVKQAGIATHNEALTVAGSVCIAGITIGSAMQELTSGFAMGPIGVIASTAFGLFGLLNQSSGASFNEIILKELQDLAKNMHAMQEEMHTSFKAVFTELEQIVDTVAKQYQALLRMEDVQKRMWDRQEAYNVTIAYTVKKQLLSNLKATLRRLTSTSMEDYQSMQVTGFNALFWSLDAGFNDLCFDAACNMAILIARIPKAAITYNLTQAK